MTRKILGDVSNTGNKRTLKQSKPLFTIAVDSSEVVKSQKKKEKKEPIPIFAGGAAGDEDVAILKLSKELDECIAAYSKPTASLFKLDFEVPSHENLLVDVRRSPERTYFILGLSSLGSFFQHTLESLTASAMLWPAPPSTNCEPPSLFDCFVDLKEEDLDF